MKFSSSVNDSEKFWPKMSVSTERRTKYEVGNSKTKDIPLEFSNIIKCLTIENTVYLIQVFEKRLMLLNMTSPTS